MAFTIETAAIVKEWQTPKGPCQGFITVPQERIDRIIDALRLGNLRGSETVYSQRCHSVDPSGAVLLFDIKGSRETAVGGANSVVELYRDGTENRQQSSIRSACHKAWIEECDGDVTPSSSLWSTIFG